MSVIDSSFKNSTVFFAPLWVDNYDKFVSTAKKDERYVERDRTDALQYLLPYIGSIYSDPKLFSSFELKAEHLSSIGMMEIRVPLPQTPVLESLRISCFSTGCAFFELTVTYGDETSLGCIEDFAYSFKNASKKYIKNGPDDNLYKRLSALLPADADLFFTASEFKMECKMFHRILLPEAINEDELVTHLCKLRRGYHQNFPLHEDDSDYDMLYRPYKHDCWAGSQEGVASITYLTDDSKSNEYVKKYKYTQLDCNYRFLYMLLLNQRFSAIKYIESISLLNRSRAKNKGKKLEELSAKITNLKTVYAFNVVSDDLIYQNVYKRMFAILDIDRLLDDIRDNEEQEQLIHNAKSLQSEKTTEDFLIFLSILSIASVLVDLSGYIDRFKIKEWTSTMASTFIVAIALVATCILLIYRKKNK